MNDHQIEPVPYDIFKNSSGLSNLNMFYDFVYIYGELCCIRQNSLCVMFLPFLASRLWYRPFKVAAENFERMKYKVRVFGWGNPLVLAYPVGGGTYCALAPILSKWKVSFQSVPSMFERIIFTFLTLFLVFFGIIFFLKCVCKIVGYVLLKMRGLNAISNVEYIKLRKLAYYDPKSKRSYFLWIPRVGLFGIFFIQSLVLQKETFTPFYDILFTLCVVSLWAMGVMSSVPTVYDYKETNQKFKI